MLEQVQLEVRYPERTLAHGGNTLALANTELHLSMAYMAVTILFLLRCSAIGAMRAHPFVCCDIRGVTPASRRLVQS
jgi:hypothetical protein